MKLSKTQKEVLGLMAEDWELGATGGINPSFWIQKGGIGKGGESKDIRSSTFFALLDNKLIKEVSAKYPYTYYGLTEKAKEVMREG